jgi:hypothetical protein
LSEAINFLANKRSQLWASVLIFGNIDSAEAIFSLLGDRLSVEKIEKLKQILSSTDIPTAWGRAIKNQIDTLINMNGKQTLAGVDQSSVDEVIYPALAKVCGKQEVAKPLHVGTVWPTMVNGKLELLVPSGGKCGVCDTDLSSNIAHYENVNDTLRTTPKSASAVVTKDVKINIYCTKLSCTLKALCEKEKELIETNKLLPEYNKFVSNAKCCDNCLKYSTNSHRCTVCLSTQYCSQECLVKDWGKFHKSVCGKFAGDENRQMPRGGKQKKTLKERTRAIQKKCTRLDCDNRGLFYCERCKEVAYCSQDCINLDLTESYPPTILSWRDLKRVPGIQGRSGPGSHLQASDGMGQKEGE